MSVLTESEKEPDVRGISFLKEPWKISFHGQSAWANSYKIETIDENRNQQSYFMKISVGEDGRAALKGEFEATSDIERVVSGFTPGPIAYGTLSSDSNSHYYLCNFLDLDQEMPDVVDFCSKLARLHQESQSPNGKFGYHVITYNGDLPQDNTYHESWERFFIQGFNHMVNISVQRGGPWKAIEEMKPIMTDKVIPRLLRPLETGGRSIKPSLVHGDLWCGNAAIHISNDDSIVYDPAGFYAHNEYELGNWRPARNKFTSTYFKEYHKHVRRSEPVEDYDERNALYAMRFNMHAAALFPDVPIYREYVEMEMKRLVEKHRGGYEEWAQTHV